MRYILAFLFPCFAWAEVGVGFVLGEPTALSARWNRNSEQALDLQFAFFRDDYMLVYGDYLFLYPKIVKLKHLTPYVGVGPLFAIATDDDHERGRYFDERDDDFALGVRVPFGFEWRLDRVPLGLGAEIAPGIVVLPATEALVQAGLSLRYYF